MRRKIVRLFQHAGYLHALADDGSLWARSDIPEGKMGWAPYPELPEAEEVPLPENL